ncbi:Ig-like domain-containing protein [Brunnivagina elsteri]|uniref:TonB-dependent receptor n=1 Tax=Brunnivagina elsteri CCALA 953 TaxID=987040 RepID=A0A2A2THU8_9CYAN|nr:Ig-like domain-containing protein [Calothrix elsteri]PAX53302.1 hypothetical protein CK510_14715 [Calothrix elsteri CCALA 953]
MKTKKLGVSIYKLGLDINKCQRGDTPHSVTFEKQVSSILCLKMLVKSNAGVLSAFLAVILPSLLGVKIFSPSTAKAATLKVTTQEVSLVEDKATDKLRSSLSRFSLSSFMVAEAEAGTTPAGQNGNSGNPSLPSISPIIPSSSPNVANPESSVNSPVNSPINPQSSPTPQVGQGTVPAPSQPALPSGIQGQKVKLDIAPAADPRAQADGRSTVKLRGTLTDENGQPIIGDVIVTLTTSAGKFVGADQSRDQQGFQVIARDGEFIATLQADIKPQQVRVRAAVDKLRVKRSSSFSPNVTQLDPRIVGPRADEPFPQQTDTSILEKLTDSPLEAYTQVEFVTFLRPSLATGIINLRIGQKGTDYWGSFGDFLNPRTIDGGTGVDFKASVFATGRVGEWLFTGAFNSYRPINQDCEGRNRLFGSIQFCEQQYPVYGDSSTMTPTTPSIDSVYARFERTPSIPGAEPDYLMWGDYNTEEFSRSSQLYTATTRQLHGLKLNYNFGQLQITGMYANNIEGFQRDTFVPNGTSGNYFLSQRLLVPGSETVYVEAEEINRPGTVIERQPLYRGQDYEIDYDRGTLLFRRPILATDLNPFGATLVRRVVVSYQNEGGRDSNLYAGRLQYNFSNDIDKKSFFGGSYLREDQGDNDFQLYGADFLVSFGSAGKIVGEFARSNSDLLTGNSVDGNAYRIEASGNLGDRVAAEGYYRAVEPNFVNNATSSFSPGQTRYGASLLARLSETTTFRAAYDFEENYGTAPGRVVDFFDLFNPQPLARPGERVSNELQTFRVGLLQRLGRGRLSPEVSAEYVNRSREDRVSDRFDGDAQQLVSRLKVPLGESLLFQAQNELNLGDSDPLYPNRTTLGLDWKAYPGVTFRLAHQFFDSSELIRGNSITTFDTLLDSKLSENTAITGRYSVLSAYNGLQGQGAVGLNNKWAIAPGLRLNLGYEYVFKNMFNATAAGPQFEQYYAVGQTSSSLGLFSGSVYSLGLEYTDNPNFQASTRFEYRDGSEKNNLVISAALAGKISPALTALVRYQQAGEANVFLPTSSSIGNSSGVRFQELGDTSSLKFGLAYRDPTNDKFNGLLKYEWRQNFDSIPESQLIGSTVTGHTFSAEGIYAPSWNWEFFGKFALRNGVTFSDGDRFDGTAKLAQLRATYRLGYRNDLAVEGRWIGQDSNNGNGYTEYGLAVESGYYLTPDLRVAAGYSFGSVDVNGDRDFSGYRSDGGFYLNISLKLNELLGGFGLQKPVPKQQQESVVQPVSGVVPQTPPVNPFPTNPSSESQPTPSIEFQQPGQTQPPQTQPPQSQTQPGQNQVSESSQGTQLQQQLSPQIDTPIGQFGNQDTQQTAPQNTLTVDTVTSPKSQNLLMNRLRGIQPENGNNANSVNSSNATPTENNELENNQSKPEEKLPQLRIQPKQSQQQLINLLKQQHGKPQVKVQGVVERSKD